MPHAKERQMDARCTALPCAGLLVPCKGYRLYNSGFDSVIQCDKYLGVCHCPSLRCSFPFKRKEMASTCFYIYIYICIKKANEPLTTKQYEAKEPLSL